ncbi:hypothetical protein ACJMK2_009641 [Sinanodonta woodiana]|uniref:Ileal sodium/bile acid cotransporter n=1 Tax=Sinanodonta woodiana TaxID=1069815 RepID=A0ABD3VF70_SINWO
MACPVKLLLIYFLEVVTSVVCTFQNASLTGSSKLSITTREEFPYLIFEKDLKCLLFDISQNESESLQIKASILDTKYAEIDGNATHIVTGGDRTNISVKVKGVFLGRTWMSLHVNKAGQSSRADDGQYDKPDIERSEEQSDWYELPEKYAISVRRKDGAMGHIFTGLVIVLVCVANVAMGCKTELQVIKDVLRRPIAPLTGLFSQFILMPMISFAVAKMLKFDPVNAFGLFAMGCAPGGAASNAYSYLLAGDVSLSVTMTLCSTVLALGMIPLWLLTFGEKVIYDTAVKIPYENILISLAGLIIPVGIGMLIKWKLPRVAEKVVWGIRPIMVIFIILVFTLGIYANLYIFDLMRDKPEILLAGALVPYLGFIFGGIVAFLARQSWKNIRTIAIETGIQNTGIAIVLLKVSLPPPDNDISIVPPVASSIFTPIPLVIAIITREIYLRCFKKKEKEELQLSDATENDHSERDENGVKHIHYHQLDGSDSVDEKHPVQAVV